MNASFRNAFLEIIRIEQLVKCKRNMSEAGRTERLRKRRSSSGPT